MSYRIAEKEVDGGFDLTITTDNGYFMDEDATSVTLHLRKDHGPRVGQRVMVGGNLVKVERKQYDQSGALWLLDEDTKTWWPAEVR